MSSIVEESFLRPHRHTFKAMGSPCELQLFTEDPALLRHAVSSVLAEIERLEARYSRYRIDSDLTRINQVAEQGGTTEVDEETSGLLNYAHTCHAQSDGLFDITSGVLRRAWRFPLGSLPDPAQLAQLLQRVGWHKLRWQPPLLEFPLAGMELDFGGIVKEYAADRAAALCRQMGVTAGLVNLGGDIHIIGPRPDGAPWRIGVRHPRAPDALVRTVALHRGALATSGDYERCIEIDGVRYSHILNPHTGWPVRHLASVSVLAELSVVAGSASTIAMLKEEAGTQWLEALGLPCYWMDNQGISGGSL